MKHYIQITAGRGPVECGRAVALVAREIFKALPAMQFADCEPHNQADDCYMSITLASKETIPQSVINGWQGTILWRSTGNPYRPAHKRSNWFIGVNFFDEVELPALMIPTSCMKPVVQEEKEARMSIRLRLQSEPYTSPPESL